LLGVLEVQTQRLEKEEKEAREKAYSIKTRSEEAKNFQIKENEETQKQIDAITMRVDDFEGKTKELYSSIQHYYAPTLELFTQLSCDPPIDATPDNNITQNNIVSYLGVLVLF
jgi:seryl-tRNA synthetase